MQSLELILLIVTLLFSMFMVHGSLCITVLGGRHWLFCLYFAIGYFTYHISLFMHSFAVNIITISHYVTINQSGQNAVSGKVLKP